MSLTLLGLLVTATTPAAATAASPAAPRPEVHVVDEKERVDLDQTDNVRLSLPTQSDRDAWADPGLRIQLGYSDGFLRGSGPALSFRTKSATLRALVRMDRYWGLGVGILYGTGPNGVRWSVTAEPTLYVWRQLSVSVGLGFGGLSVNNPNASTGRLNGATEHVSRDLTEGESLRSCTGSALTSLLRSDYLFVTGPLFATGPFVQGSAQMTRCQATFGNSDPETGRPVTLTQWWQQWGVSFGWWFAWR